MSAPWTGCTPSCRLALATLSKSHLRPQLTASLLSCPSRIHTPLFPHQHQSQSRPSSSNSRWKARQGTDIFAREAKVQGLKSRAAFKLLEIDARYHLFKARQTVVDLGYAPGSWSQVALERTKPNGRIVGIDLIPAQPPKGVSAIQGNFLAPGVQGMVKRWLVEGERARREGKEVEGEGEEEGKREERASYIEIERMAVKEEAKVEAEVEAVEQRVEKDAAAKAKELRLVDVRDGFFFLHISLVMAMVMTLANLTNSPLTGSPQRHVRTLAPDPRVFHQQFK